MTCILGLVNGDDVWVAADSHCSHSELRIVKRNSKLFRSGELLLGGAGQFRASQIIEQSVDVPEWPKTIDALEYLVCLWIPAARAALSYDGHLPQSSAADNLPTDFLVGARGRLFTIGCDWAVLEHEKIAAIGTGSHVAIGALQVVTRNLPVRTPARKKLEISLEAAAHHIDSVCAPFHIEKA